MKEHFQLKWTVRVERMVKAYQDPGTLTAREFESWVIDTMPCGGAAELIARLPPEVVAMIRENATDPSHWDGSEKVWVSLVPYDERTDEEQEQDRQEYLRKLAELRDFFTVQQP